MEYLLFEMKKWSNIELADEGATPANDRWVVLVTVGLPTQQQCVDDPSLSTQHMLAMKIGKINKFNLNNLTCNGQHNYSCITKIYRIR